MTSIGSISDLSHLGSYHSEDHEDPGRTPNPNASFQQVQETRRDLKVAREARLKAETEG
jgi:hypothetical protein